jgi:hypothetical protein
MNTKGKKDFSNANKFTNQGDRPVLLKKPLALS